MLNSVGAQNVHFCPPPSSVEVHAHKDLQTLVCLAYPYRASTVNSYVPQETLPHLPLSCWIVLGLSINCLVALFLVNTVHVFAPQIPGSPYPGPTTGPGSGGT